MKTEEIEALKKTLHDAAEGLKAATADNEERVKRLVEETIKTALRSHPGFTPQRTIEHPVLTLVGGEKSEMVKMLPAEVQVEADKVYVISKLLNVHPKQLKSWGRFQQIFEAKASDFKKALDSTTAGGVDEWVPTELSPNLVEKVRLELKVASLFPLIKMPTNPFELPVEVGDFASFKQPENTGDTGQTIIPIGDTSNISNKVTLSAVGHATRILMSKEAAEDSILAMWPLVERKIVLALAQGREDAILNGDTAGSHEDTDVTAADSRRKLFLGLRAMANDNASTMVRDMGTMSLNQLLEQRGDMGVYGVNPSDLAWITGIRGLIKLMQIDVVQTLDKIGANAVVLKGQLGVVAGSPLIISEFVRQDLNASGVYQSGETKTVLQCVNRNAFVIGERGNPTTQMLRELYAIYGQDAMIATERIDFKPLFAASSNPILSSGVNVG